MNPDLFFDNFEMLLEGPNGIPKMREMILQMAVQGKLVEQDPDDEPARVLLERIRGEKEKLVKEGKIKKSKALPEIEEGEIFHAIPSNWIWVKLGDVVNYNGTEKVSSELIPDNAWLLDLADIEKDSSKLLQKISCIDRKSKSTKTKFKSGDVLYGKLRPYLNKVIIADEDGYCTTEIVPLTIYYGIIPTYLLYALKRTDFLKYVNSKTYGVKMPRLGTEDAKNALLPLPPLNEQKQIVAKVDQLMALCDQLEALKQKRKETRVRLNESALDKLLNAGGPEEFAKHWQLICENFDLLYDDLDNLKKLRQAILQLAVQGKLVEQDDSDEPAGVLLERIKGEKERLVKEGKIKKSKALPEIEEGEIFHAIPSNWIWVKLGDVVNYNGTEKVSSELIPDNAWLLDLADIEKNNSKILQKVLCADRKSKSTKTKFKSGDVLYGKLRPYLNKVIVADEDGYCTTEIVPLTIYYGIIPAYLLYALKRPDFLEYVNSKTYGVKMPRLGTEDAKNALLPLPPLNEQKRIVAKVDQLMALCNQLEEKINKAQPNSDMIMEVAMDNLLKTAFNHELK